MSPTGSRQALGSGALADCQSATRQTASLRYAVQAHGPDAFQIGSWFCRALFLAALLLTSLPAQAEDAVRYQARPGSKMTIAGTSSIHDWTMDGQIIGGYFEVPAGVVWDQSQAALPGATGGKLNARAETTIPVRSMKSGHDGMDEVMQQAMNEKEHPRIQYRLSEMTLKEPHAAGTPFQFDTKGDLIVNGVTNVITMPVSIESTDKSRLKVGGKVALKMTDFQVKPPAPKLALGLIKTGDDITISFEWLVALPQGGGGAKAP